jgi:hypothetical protein
LSFSLKHFYSLNQQCTNAMPIYIKPKKKGQICLKWYHAHIRDVMVVKFTPLLALIFFAMTARPVWDSERLNDGFLRKPMRDDLVETYPELYQERAEATGCPACHPG